MWCLATIFILLYKVYIMKRAHNFINLTGQKFSRLLVVKFYKKNKSGVYWWCKCECGTEKKILGMHLKSGKTQSCGCFRKEINRKKETKHGLCKTPFYRCWSAMMQRCYNENYHRFKDHGGRGIKVCKRWNKFENFRDDMYESYKKHKKNNPSTQIERKNNNGNYTSSNCCWKTNKEQSNNKRDNHLLTYKGKTQTMMRWSEELGINYNTLKSRINLYKWPVEKALSKLIRK